MPLELIVFDWDGTLMDSIGTIVACAQKALQDLGREPLLEATIRDLVGLRLDIIAARLLTGADEAELSRFVERYSHHWRHGFAGDLRPLGMASRALEALESRGQLMAVATGKSRHGLDRDLETTGFKRFFAASRTVNESPSKPSPAMLLELMDELGVRAGATLMVGDTTHDIEMAQNAGVASLGVLTGSHDRDRLLAAGALECLPSVGELAQWLDGESARRLCVVRSV